MPGKYELVDEHESSDGECVRFTLNYDRGAKAGTISRSALWQLDRNMKQELIKVFQDHREKIGHEAHMHAMCHAPDISISLGSTDF